MTAFIAYWPDSSISVISYPSGCSDETYEAWLYDDLDAEADPLQAKVFRLPSGFHLQTETWIGVHKQTKKKAALLSVTSFHLDAKRPRRFEWSPDVAFKSSVRMRMESRKKNAADSASDRIAEYLGDESAYPSLPETSLAIEEVRKMESFAGIYIAICETTGVIQYVGKSRDVPRRVSKSRPELEGCRIAIIGMAEDDIHFAELHYIAKLRPRRNRVGRTEATDGA